MRDSHNYDHILIRLDKASVTRSGKRLLDEVGLELYRCGHLALLGPNGAGKSTLLGLMHGDMPPDRASSRTYFLDEPCSSPIGIKERMGLVSSEIHEKCVVMGWKATGMEVILAGFNDDLLLYDAPDPEHLKAARGVMDVLDINDLAEKIIPAMSTGELRKVLIARALAPAPDILFLDECLEGLDAESRAGVLECLDRAAEKATLVCTAHRMEDIPDSVQRAMFVQNGRVVSEDVGSTGEQSFSELASTKLEPNFVMPSSHEDGVEFLVLIRDSDVVIDGKTILEQINWRIRPGERWALQGANGAGKTTMLRLILGLIRPVEPGEIHWFGQERLRDLAPLRRRIGLVSDSFQAAYGRELARKPTVEETVLSGFFAGVGLLYEPDDNQREKAREAMDYFGIIGLAEKNITTLSSGQMRRTLLARAMVSGPDLLLLDEPLTGLDAQSRTETTRLVEALAESGVSMIYVTHRADEVPDCIDRILRLENGRVVFER